MRILFLLFFMVTLSPSLLVAQERHHLILNDTLELKSELIYLEEFDDLNNWKNIILP